MCTDLRKKSKSFKGMCLHSSGMTMQLFNRHRIAMQKHLTLLCTSQPSAIVFKRPAQLIVLQSCKSIALVSSADTFVYESLIGTHKRTMLLEPGSE